MNVEEELLKSDFEKSYEQMRHYDSSFQNLTTIILGAYLGVIGSIATLFGLKIEFQQVIIGIGIILIFMASSSTIFILILARNRVYFTIVARYVNEVRDHYVRKQPFGFRNKSKFYTDCHFPKAWNIKSTHFIVLMFLIFINSISIYTGVIFLRNVFTNEFVYFWGVDLVIVVVYILSTFTTIYFILSPNDRTNSSVSEVVTYSEGGDING